MLTSAATHLPHTLLHKLPTALTPSPGSSPLRPPCPSAVPLTSLMDTILSPHSSPSLTSHPPFTPTSHFPLIPLPLSHTTLPSHPLRTLSHLSLRQPTFTPLPHTLPPSMPITSIRALPSHPTIPLPPSLARGPLLPCAEGQWLPPGPLRHAETQDSASAARWTVSTLQHGHRR